MTKRGFISAYVLSLLASLCSSCASNEFADYPSKDWPALRHGSPCTEITGSYEAITREVSPAPLTRMSSSDAWISLADVLTDVSPNPRLENSRSIVRIHLDISGKQATLFGARQESVELGHWHCSNVGALEATTDSETEGEGTIGGRVKIRYELRLAADGSLVVHQVEEFSELLSKKHAREKWLRFLPAKSPET